jgi:hypothetical protein
VLPPGQGREEEEERCGSAAGDQERGWDLGEWDHESGTGL